MLIRKTLVNNGLSIPCFAVANMKDAVNHARRMATNGLLLLILVDTTANQFVIRVCWCLLIWILSFFWQAMLLFWVQVVRALMNSEILSTEGWFFRSWPSQHSFFSKHDTNVKSLRPSLIISSCQSPSSWMSMFDRILLVKYCHNANRYTHIQTCVYNITISRIS